MHIQKLLMVSYFALGSLLAGSAAATPLADSSTVIPFENVRAEATDLIYQGRRLLPQEAAQLRDQGFDISQLDPDSTTDVWSPRPQTQQQVEALDAGAFTVRSGDMVDFLRILPSPGKIFRFVIRHRGSDGVERLYTIFLARRTQTYLLRRNLLRKLGYVIPPMERLDRLKVQFSSALAKQDFIENKSEGLRVSVLGDKQWITNLEDKNSRILDLQDVVLYETQEYPVNLSSGVIRPDINQGRRVINALFIPYNLVDVRESINGMRWHSAQVRSNALSLPLEDEEGFTTTMSDARWIMRKILQLTRQDWEQIVSYDTGYPVAAQKLLLEKLISRRNEMRRLLKMQGQDLSFNPAVSYGEDLKNGELLKGDWDGVAASLSNGELPSLLSGGEMTALFKSKGISTAIGELVRRVNMDLLPHTDLAQKTLDAHVKEFYKDLEHYIKTGEERKAGLGIWSTPYYSAQLIASREVVAGSYLGTDNRVQLADTFGVGMETGLYLGTTGLKPQAMIDASAKLTYYRVYAHLKPLKSIKTSLHEPYENLVVPLLRQEWAGLIDPQAFEKKEGETDEDLAARVTKIVQTLKDHLGDGESLIVTDSLGAAANVRAGYALNDRIRAQAEFGAGQIILSRLHMLRLGDQVHVYKDFGNMKSIHFTITLRAAVEVLGINVKFSQGTAKTEFFNLDLTDDMARNPDLPLVLNGMRDILLANSVRRLTLFAEPHTLEHKLKENQSEFNFLFWNHFNLKNEDMVTVRRKDEDQPEQYVRRLIGTRSGEDYQTLSVDILNEILQEVLHDDINVRNTTSGDPGDTLYGKSKARYSYFEGELDGTEYSEMFVGVIYRWKGWSANRSKLEKIVKEFSDRFSFQFYHPQAFQQIKKAELYNLNLRIFIYDRGVRHVMGLTPDQFQGLLDRHTSHPGSDRYEYRKKAMRAFSWLKRKYDKYLKKHDARKLGDVIVRAVSLVESSLDSEGLQQAVGGNRNLLIQPVLQGFFQGEDGKLAEIPIEGNQIGEIGSDRPYGPLTSTQLELGMIESEFFAYWLLRRI